MSFTNTVKRVIVLFCLLDQLEVKGLKLKNRIVMPPMQTSLATHQGAVTNDLIEHYVRRSKALGLLIVEHSYVTLDGRFSERQVGVHEDGLVDGLEKLSSSVHATGTPIVLQLNHAGGKANMEVTDLEPVAPSAIPNARELKAEETKSLIEAFTLSTERAMMAGFDGVEVHGAHGFLINQFYSPITNRRTDMYGGSPGKRMRFALEVVEQVREMLRGRLLLYRLGVDDLDPAGVNIDDSKHFAVKLEEAGVDIIDVSGGMCGSRPDRLRGKQGYFIPQAQEIKKVVSIPVIGVGSITEVGYADKLIREDRIDLVAIGRALLEGPDWAKQAVEKLELEDEKLQ